MKLLCLADKIDPGLWDYYRREKTAGIDMILACGDLPPKYLEFLVTMANCPLLYVRGNHDELVHMSPPEGCECVEDKLVTVNGLKILGLGGSMKYRDGEDMYTERQMARRVRLASLKTMLSGGVDIVMTHAPVRGYGDLPDIPHQGFDCFDSYLTHFHPRFLVHGHVHATYTSGKFQRVREHPSGTRIINAYESYMLEL